MKEPLKESPWWIKAIVTAILSILGTLYTLSYTGKKTDQKDLIRRVEVVEQRTGVLEAHQSDQSDDIKYIRRQIERLSDYIVGSHK